MKERNKMKIDNIIKTFAKSGKASTILSIKNYKTNKGKTKDYLLNFHSSYKNAIERSVVQLFKFQPKTDEEKVAKEEIMESLKRSIDSFADDSVVLDGKPVNGLKNASGKVFITGLLVNQDSKPTNVKQEIFSKLPVSRFRQFEISPDKMGAIILNGRKIKVA